MLHGLPHGHRLKFFYAAQTRQAPPTFLLFVNRADLLSDQYKKYLGDSMRAAFGYEGCLLVLVPKERPKTIEPKRAFKKQKPGGRPGQNPAPGGRRSRAGGRSQRSSRTKR